MTATIGQRVAAFAALAGAAWVAGCASDAATRAASPQPVPRARSHAEPTASIDAVALPEPALSATAQEAAVQAPPIVEESGPRIGSQAYITWIYRRASRADQPIGFVRPGTSVALREKEPVAGTDCAGGKWHAIEPHGFVCADQSTTLDLASPLYNALQALRPPNDAPLPYRYAYSLGSPMYGRVPSVQEAQRAERAFTPVDKLVRDRKARSGYEELATSEILPGVGEAPSMFASGAQAPRMHGFDTGLVRKRIPEASMMSFVTAFEANGRTWLVTPELTLVPSDRVRPFRVTSFHGVAIGKDAELPFAWTRHDAKAKFRRDQAGTLLPTSDAWEPRVVVPLTGVRVQQGSVEFLETREAGTFLRASDASVVQALERTPTTVEPEEHWIEFSTGKGTLTLFVGTTPVFSTLASPGAGGGAPRSGMSNEELVHGSYTPLGIYRIEYKTRATTMTPEGTPNPEKHWISDVPHTQYFRRPFAIHTAYWHEDFGMPKSGGCINLSPADALRVFGWTAPRVPEDWSGASSHASNGLGTKVVIRR